MAEREPFLGVPKGSVNVQNPDGVYRGDHMHHSLYDTKVPLAQPVTPGDYDNNREVTNPKT